MTQRYVVLVLRVVVPGGSCSGGRECRGWSGGGWSGGSSTPACAAGAAPRKAALDAGFVVHLAQKKVVGGIAPFADDVGMEALNVILQEDQKESHMPRTMQGNVAVIKLLLTQRYRRQVGQVPYSDVMLVDRGAGRSRTGGGVIVSCSCRW